jgi:uncharacterized protein
LWFFARPEGGHVESAQTMTDMHSMAEYFSPQRLRLILFPTEKCNFRCTYCYEDFALGRMADSVADGIVALVASRSPDLKYLDIDWFGGEPLLAKELIFRVGSEIFDLCRGYSILLRGSITSNGYLLSPEVARALLARGITRFQISIDGPQSVHDSRRLTAGGRGSFETITRNLSALLQIEGHFKLILRVHFDPTTLEQVKEFIRAEVQEWAQDERVEFLFYHVDNLSEDKSAHVPQLSWSERRAAVSELRSLVPRSIGTYDTSYVCYAAQPNAFVVRADGRLAKCTVALHDDANTIGLLLPDGRIELDNDKAREWMAGWATLDWRTLACPYATMKRERSVAA